MRVDLRATSVKSGRGRPTLFISAELTKGEVVIMYTSSDVTPAVAAVTTAVVLPNTGVASNAVSLAVAVVVGLAVWGVMYARANR